MHYSIVVLSMNMLLLIKTDFDYGLLRLSDLDYWLTAGVSGQQGMLTPPRHPSLVYPGVRVCLALIFVLFLDYEIDYGTLFNVTGIQFLLGKVI